MEFVHVLGLANAMAIVLAKQRVDCLSPFVVFRFSLLMWSVWLLYTDFFGSSGFFQLASNFYLNESSQYLRSGTEFSGSSPV